MVDQNKNQKSLMQNSGMENSEILEKKIKEKNVEREITRRELIGALRSVGLFREFLFEGVIPFVTELNNAMGLTDSLIVENYVRRQIQEIDHLIKDFVLKGGHLRYATDVVSNYKGFKVIVPSELANSYEIFKILKVIENIGISCEGIKKSLEQPYKCMECEISSDHILWKVNALRFHIFQLDQLLTYTRCFEFQSGELMVSEAFKKVFNDLMRRFYEVYLIVNYNVLIEYEEN